MHARLLGDREAVEAAAGTSLPPTHMVIGLAPDGGRLGRKAREDVIRAVGFGLSVDSGLRDISC